MRKTGGSVTFHMLQSMWGTGGMVHAANESRGVVKDALRTKNVVFYARPY